MDDILTGASTEAEARNLQQQLTKLCLAGGFPLRKWSANDRNLLADIPPEHRMQRDTLSWQPEESHTTLGMHWHPSIDSISFATKSIAVPAFTKRAVLSLTARLFDPLGWLAPAIVRAKILFQSTWLQGLDWDTPLDDSSERAWRSFKDDLPRLEEIRVPRYVKLRAKDASVELHGFADASERAYTAVIYVRSTICEENPDVNIIAAKTKVAPIKLVTLPRLELCAAALLVRLMANIRQILGVMDAPVHLWSTPPSHWVGSAVTRRDGRRTSQIESPRSRPPCQTLDGTISRGRITPPTAPHGESLQATWSLIPFGGGDHHGSGRTSLRGKPPSRESVATVFRRSARGHTPSLRHNRAKSRRN